MFVQQSSIGAWFQLQLSVGKPRLCYSWYCSCCCSFYRRLLVESEFQTRDLRDHSDRLTSGCTNQPTTFRSTFRSTWPKTCDHVYNLHVSYHTLQEINISHLGKRKIIFKYALSGGYVNSLESTFWWTHILGGDSWPLNKVNSIVNLAVLFYYATIIHCCFFLHPGCCRILLHQQYALIFRLKRIWIYLCQKEPLVN